MIEKNVENSLNEDISNYLSDISNNKHEEDNKENKNLNVFIKQKNVKDRDDLKPFTNMIYKHYNENVGKTKFSSPDEEYEWMKTEFKKCNECGETLPLTKFGLNTSGSYLFNKDGTCLHRSECLKCGRKYTISKNEAVNKRKKEGLPTKAPKGTKCDICGRTHRVNFDHDPKTNIFRGWLCVPCNTKLGAAKIAGFGSEIDGTFKEVNYLMKNMTITDSKGNTIKNISIENDVLKIE